MRIAVDATVLKLGYPWLSKLRGNVDPVGFERIEAFMLESRQIPKTLPGTTFLLDIPGFCNLDYDAPVACLPGLSPPENPPRYAPIKSGDNLLSRFKTVQKYAPTPNAPANAAP